MSDKEQPFAVFELPELGESGTLEIRGCIGRGGGQWQTVSTRECAWNGSKWTETINGEIVEPATDLFAAGILPMWIHDTLRDVDPLISYDNSWSE